MHMRLVSLPACIGAERPACFTGLMKLGLNKHEVCAALAASRLTGKFGAASQQQARTRLDWNTLVLTSVTVTKSAPLTTTPRSALTIFTCSKPALWQRRGSTSGTRVLLQRACCRLEQQAHGKVHPAVCSSGWDARLAHTLDPAVGDIIQGDSIVALDIQMARVSACGKNKTGHKSTSGDWGHAPLGRAPLGAPVKCASRESQCSCKQTAAAAAPPHHSLHFMVIVNVSKPLPVTAGANRCKTGCRGDQQGVGRQSCCTKVVTQFARVWCSRQN